MARRYKSDLLDPFEALKPSNINFMTKHYKASSQRESFHMRDAYMYTDDGSSRDCSFGVDKRMYNATNCGCLFDGQFVGKTNE